MVAYLLTSSGHLNPMCVLSPTWLDTLVWDMLFPPFALTLISTSFSGHCSISFLKNFH